MKIGARPVGDGHPPYIIAEIGVNHDGSVERAIELTDAAAHAGADAVKLQIFRAEMLMSPSAPLAAYQRARGEEDPISMLRRLELDWGAAARVINRARSRGLHAIATVFSVPLVPEAQEYEFDAFKVASPDIVHQPLVEAVAALGRPLILSTGAATVEEILRAQHWTRGRQTMFLHCVSAYPVAPEHAALGAIGPLSRALGAAVGYSDHTTAEETGALAVAAGACMLEKHLTHDRRAAGPDHSASLDPAQFAEYVRQARLAHAMMGAGEKSVSPVETDVRGASRQSIVSGRAVRAGEALRANDVAFKRPGHGMEPWRLAEVVGKRARRALAEGEMIRPEDLA